MKQIKFEPRSAVERKQRIIAVAYATQKVGGWKSNNVTGDIIDYLNDDGYIVTAKRDTSPRANLVGVIAEAMEWLADKGYAARVVVGRRTTEFVMDPDVNVPVPAYLQGKLFRDSKNTQPTKVADPTRPPVMVAPRLPSQSLGPDLTKLEEQLTRWWRRTPEAAEEWISQVCEDLETGL